MEQESLWGVTWQKFFWCLERLATGGIKPQWSNIHKNCLSTRRHKKALCNLSSKPQSWSTVHSQKSKPSHRGVAKFQKRCRRFNVEMIESQRAECKQRRDSNNHNKDRWNVLPPTSLSELAHPLHVSFSITTSCANVASYAPREILPLPQFISWDSPSEHRVMNCCFSADSFESSKTKNCVKI